MHLIIVYGHITPNTPDLVWMHLLLTSAKFFPALSLPSPILCPSLLSFFSSRGFFLPPSLAQPYSVEQLMCLPGWSSHQEWGSWDSHTVPSFLATFFPVIGLLPLSHGCLALFCFLVQNSLDYTFLRAKYASNPALHGFPLMRILTSVFRTAWVKEIDRKRLLF